MAKKEGFIDVGAPPDKKQRDKIFHIVQNKLCTAGYLWKESGHETPPPDNVPSELPAPTDEPNSIELEPCPEEEQKFIPIMPLE